MRTRRTPGFDPAQLAAAVQTILDDYRRFLAEGEAGDPKAFAARHAAARSALAHLDQLMKFAGDTEEEDSAATDCIAEARQALATLPDEERASDGEPDGEPDGAAG